MQADVQVAISPVPSLLLRLTYERDHGSDKPSLARAGSAKLLVNQTNNGTNHRPGPLRTTVPRAGPPLAAAAGAMQRGLSIQAT